MMEVLLKILSAIGILLLVLLILILVLLVLILFWPIRYRIKAEKNAEKTLVRVRVGWLFGIFRFCFDYPDPGSPIVKVLWFSLTDTKRKSEPSVSVTSPEDIPQDETDLQSDEISKTQDDREHFDEQKQTTGDSIKEPDPESEKADHLFAKIRYTISGFCDKMKKILSEITFYRDLLDSPDTRELFRHILQRFGRILKQIRPRRLRAYVVFGAASPDITGYVTAVYGILSSAIGPNVVFCPDFEQTILEGNLDAAGHISTCTILVQGLRILFDRRLHEFRRKLKNHKIQNQK